MKAYGTRKGDELEYRDLGAPSRERKTTSKVRIRARRRLHKQGRNDGTKLLRTLVKELS